MILHFYIARRFLRSLMIVAAVFLGILIPIDLTEQMSIIRSSGAGFPAALELALLNLPGGFYVLLPSLTMLATLVLFLSLARTSELVVVRASGRSALRSAMSPVVVAILLGFLGLLVLNPIVAATEREYELAVSRYETGEERTLSVSADGLWLRQGSQRGQTVIRAEQANSDGTSLTGASFFSFDAEGRLLRRIDAEQATLEDGAWVMTEAKLWPLADADNPEAAATLYADYTLASTLTREQIRDSFGKPSTVPIYELPGFIAQLNQAGFAGLQHRVWLHSELTNPLMLAAMVLIGASFTMRHTRFGKTGLMVMYALMLGFGVFFLRDFALVLGETGQLPVIVAAWAPPIAAVLLCVAYLLHTEDG